MLDIFFGILLALVLALVVCPFLFVVMYGRIMVDGLREKRLNQFAASALEGLMANPERYKYISTKVDSGELTQEAATAKNAAKALMVAKELSRLIEAD